MRGYINKPNFKMLGIFAFILLPICVLAYQEKIALGNIDSLNLIILVIFMLITSIVEIPIHNIRTKKSNSLEKNTYSIKKMYGVSISEEMERGKGFAFDTKITLNLGGFIIPLIVSLYLISTNPYTSIIALMIIMIVVVSIASKMIDGVGIVVPHYIGLVSIPFALIIAPHNAAIISFIANIGGILIGTVAALISFDKEKKGSAYLNLGGIGIFESTYITLIIALILFYFTI